MENSMYNMGKVIVGDLNSWENKCVTDLMNRNIGGVIVSLNNLEQLYRNSDFSDGYVIHIGNRIDAFSNCIGTLLANSVLGKMFKGDDM
jgi:hypothetical protein